MEDYDGGDVYQIDPEYDKLFGGCFLTVTMSSDWGVQGYVKTPMEKGLAFYRCEYKYLKYIGKATWIDGQIEAIYE